MTAGDPGPAATRTASAGVDTPSTDDPDDGVAAPVEGGRPTGAHPDAAPLGDRRVGVGRGGRRDRVADPDPAAPHAGRDRRFDRLERGPARDDALELGERIGQRPVDGADGGLVRGHVDEAGRLRAEPEPDIGRGQLAVQADRLAVERREDRVERVLDDAGVRPRRAGRQPVALDQRHGRSGLGEEGAAAAPTIPPPMTTTSVPVAVIQPRSVARRR